MPSQFGFKELLFPVAGLNRKNAIQSQPPYTTLDALNVRPYRPESKRMAGGSRPGFHNAARRFAAGDHEDVFVGHAGDHGFGRNENGVVHLRKR